MKVFGLDSSHALEMATRPRRSKLLASAMSAALLATVVVAGSAASATTISAARTPVARPSLAHAKTPAAPKYYLQQSGKGSKTLRSVVLPSKWYLIWKFDCGVKKATFTLSSTRKGDKPEYVNGAKGQTGLGGGGQLPFKMSGTYRFATKTTCSWTVSAASGPPVAAK
jgi:hypothetical protein